MKRGILELADVLAVNKADGDRREEAERAARELSAALRLLRGADGDWQPPVLTCSGLEGSGLERVWKHLQRHHEHLLAHGEFEAKRRRQLVDWTRSMVAERLLSVLDSPHAKALVAEQEAAVLAGELTADEAAAAIVAGVRDEAGERA
jgi:LAO/AO transport system kinase